MDNRDFVKKLTVELLFGAPEDFAYVSNPGTPGLLAVLDQLSPEQASHFPSGAGPSVAAHANHIRFFLDLLIRLANGEADPFAVADWEGSWQVGQLDAASWETLRTELRKTSNLWIDRIAETKRDDKVFRENLTASLPHLGYHIGTIKQLVKVAHRMPKNDER